MFLGLIFILAWNPRLQPPRPELISQPFRDPPAPPGCEHGSRSRGFFGGSSRQADFRFALQRSTRGAAFCGSLPGLTWSGSRSGQELRLFWKQEWAALPARRTEAAGRTAGPFLGLDKRLKVTKRGVQVLRPHCLPAWGRDWVSGQPPGWRCQAGHRPGSGRTRNIRLTQLWKLKRTRGWEPSSILLILSEVPGLPQNQAGDHRFMDGKPPGFRRCIPVPTPVGIRVAQRQGGSCAEAGAEGASTSTGGFMQRSPGGNSTPRGGFPGVQSAPFKTFGPEQTPAWRPRRSCWLCAHDRQGRCSALGGAGGGLTRTPVTGTPPSQTRASGAPAAGLVLLSPRSRFNCTLPLFSEQGLRLGSLAQVSFLPVILGAASSQAAGGRNKPHSFKGADRQPRTPSILAV